MAARYKPRRREGRLKPVEKFEMRQFREAGMSVKQCAAYFDVSVATAMAALAEMVEKLGPEILPKNRKHLARRRIQNSPNLTSDKH